MNNLKKLALVAALTLTITSLSTSAEAYRCAWRNGHRVCWHETNYGYYHYYPNANSHRYVVYTGSAYGHCWWVNGHWRHGYWQNGYRVCR